MTWQERLTLVLLVALAAFTLRVADAPGRLRAWYWRHRRNWKSGPPSPYGGFDAQEWESYKQKNPEAWP